MQFYKWQITAANQQPIFKFCAANFYREEILKGSGGQTFATCSVQSKLYFCRLFQMLMTWTVECTFSNRAHLCWTWLKRYFGLLKWFPDLTVDLHSAVTYPQVCRPRSTAATLVYWSCWFCVYIFIFIFFFCSQCRDSAAVTPLFQQCKKESWFWILTWILISCWFVSC